MKNYTAIALFICICLIYCSNDEKNIPQETLYTNSNIAISSQPKDTIFQSSVSESAEVFNKWKVKKLNINKDLWSIEFADSQNGWIGSGKGDFFQTHDGGENWELLLKSSNSKTSLNNLTFINSLIGWKSLIEQKSSDDFKSTILQTKDGGKNWTPQFSERGVSIANIVFINENEGWVVGFREVMRKSVYYEFFILHTIDGGLNWDEVSSNLANAVSKRSSNASSIRDIYSSESDIATVIVDEHQLFKTMDGGKSWKSDGGTDLGNRRPQFLRPPNGNYTILASVGGYHCCDAILAKKEGNNSWSKNILSGFYLSDAVFLSENEILACGTMSPENNDINNFKEYGVIVFSPDSGKNWQILYLNKKIEQINTIAISGEKKVWAVGDKGFVVSAFIKDLVP